MLDIEFDDFELGSKRPPTQWVAVAPPVNPRHTQRSDYHTDCHFRIAKVCLRLLCMLKYIHLNDICEIWQPRFPRLSSYNSYSTH